LKACSSGGYGSRYAGAHADGGGCGCICGSGCGGDRGRLDTAISQAV